MKMAACLRFQTQLSSIMEVLVKAAVAEISKLVDDKCAFLHLELSRRQSENEMLRRKLRQMEGKQQQQDLQQQQQHQKGFENYMDRGSDLSSSCPHPAELKFGEVQDAATSFMIKEESPDEVLWISDPAGATGPAGSYCPAAHAHRNQPVTAEATGEKAPEFGRPFSSGQLPVDANGLHFTIKTEKEDGGPLVFGQDGCQRGVGKQNSVTADFSMDERESQLWSSIMEGGDIDGSFPDFSSVVEEYSSSFNEQPDAANVASVKPPGAHQQSSSSSSSAQRSCNGVYKSEFHVSQLSASAAGTDVLPVLPDKPKEQQVCAETLNPQREESPRGDRATPSPHPFLMSHFYPGRPASGVARGHCCSQCGKSFSRLHQFKLHQQTHKRKRTFWCGVCGKSFQCSSHLSIHHRTHTGEKPYGCGQCGKRFTQQSSLRVHQRTHSGERPYSCSQCGKTFILMHHLKRHRIIHTYN